MGASKSLENKALVCKNNTFPCIKLTAGVKLSLLGANRLMLVENTACHWKTDAIHTLPIKTPAKRPARVSYPEVTLHRSTFGGLKIIGKPSIGVQKLYIFLYKTESLGKTKPRGCQSAHALSN